MNGISISTDRDLETADVVIVVPPFSAVTSPAIGPGLLAAGCRRRGLTVVVYYANIVLAAMVGNEANDAICLKMPSELFAGEALFRPFIEPSLPFSVIIDEMRDIMAGLRLVGSLGGEAGFAQIREQLNPVSAAIPDFLERSSAEILAKSPRIIAFSSMFQQSFASAAIARQIRARIGSEAVLVLGGANTKFVQGSDTLDVFPVFDFVFRGEADFAFPDFCYEFVRRGILPGEQIIDCGIVEDLSKVETPDFFDYFVQASSAKVEDSMSSALACSILFESSRGCWWSKRSNCSFCGMTGGARAFREKAADRVLSEIDELIERHGVLSLTATDLVVPPSFLKKGGLFSQLSNRHVGLQIFYEVKANLSAQAMDLLAEGGVRFIQAGIESLSSPVLSLMGKGCNALQNLVLLRDSAARGLGVIWNFLVGVPGETAEDYKDLPSLIEAIMHLHPPTYLGAVRVDRFSPYCETPSSFGIRNLRSPRMYRFLFADLTRNLQPQYFDADIQGSLLEDPGALSSLAMAIERWMELWERGDSSPRLVMIRLSEASGLIEDTRPGAKERFVSVTPSILECLAATRKPVSARLATGLDQGALKEAIDLRWIVFLDGFFLSVVTEPGSPATEPAFGNLLRS